MLCLGLLGNLSTACHWVPSVGIRIEKWGDIMDVVDRDYEITADENGHLFAEDVAVKNLVWNLTPLINIVAEGKFLRNSPQIDLNESACEGLM